MPVEVDVASAVEEVKPKEEEVEPEEEEEVLAEEEDVVGVVLVAFAVAFALPLPFPRLWRRGTGTSAWPGKVGGCDDGDADEVDADTAGAVADKRSWVDDVAEVSSEVAAKDADADVEVAAAIVALAEETLLLAVAAGVVAAITVLCHCVLPQSDIVANATSGRLDTAVRLAQSLTASVFGSC